MDFSAHAENALKYAIRLANFIDADLIVLSVSKLDGGVSENPVSLRLRIQEEISLSRKRLVDLINKTKDGIEETLNPALQIEPIAEMGKIENSIQHEAISHDVDCIILGTQEAKAVQHIVSNVLKDTSISVLLIPENASFKKKINLAYATDLSSADPFEIWRAIKLLKPFDPAVKCIHFSENHDNSLDKIKELESFFSEIAPDLDIEFHNIIATDLVKDMNDFIETKKINKLVTYRPHRNFFESIFHKSFTKKMAQHINVPLLALKDIK